jgi:hypothetical protein
VMCTRVCASLRQQQALCLCTACLLAAHSFASRVRIAHVHQVGWWSVLHSERMLRVVNMYMQTICATSAMGGW